MNFFAMRVDADLNLFDIQFPQTPGLFFTNQDGIGLELYVESQRTRVFDDLEAVAAYQWLATADGEKENAGVGQLIEKVADFGGIHFAVAIVLEITMFAALVAAVG